MKDKNGKVKWWMWATFLLVLALVSFALATLAVYESNASTGLRAQAARNELRQRNTFSWPETEETHDVVAAIIEPRRHRNLVFVINHLHEVLPHVPIHVFHGRLNQDMIPTGDHITLHEIPFDNIQIPHYNAICMDPAFYKALPGRHILIFQTDSVVFSKSQVRLEEFYPFDYVGAPHDTLRYSLVEWKSQKHFRVGNGGLSLRRRSMMLQCLETTPLDKALYMPEDVYFSHEVIRQGGKIPSEKEAARFSFQSVYADVLPFGAHRNLPTRWIDQMTPEEIAVFKPK